MSKASIFDQCSNCGSSFGEPHIQRCDRTWPKAGDFLLIHFIRGTQIVRFERVTKTKVMVTRWLDSRGGFGPTVMLPKADVIGPAPEDDPRLRRAKAFKPVQV